VNGLEVEEVVVWDVYTDAEVETGVAPIDDLVVPKLDEVCVLRISNCKDNEELKFDLSKLEESRYSKNIAKCLKRPQGHYLLFCVCINEPQGLLWQSLLYFH